MNAPASRLGRIAGTALAAAALVGVGWAGYAAITWSRYGKVAHRGKSDELLDQVMPVYEVRELHETGVAAPAALTYEAALDLDFERSTLVRAIFRGRELLMGARQGAHRSHGFLQEILALGWRMLAEVPGRQMVFGAVTTPWVADVQFRGLPPETFAGFDDPGYAKIAWTFSAEPLGPVASIFRTETRVITTDPESRERFRRYWSVVSPGVLLIRREALRLVKAEAERRARTALAAPV